MTITAPEREKHMPKNSVAEAFTRIWILIKRLEEEQTKAFSWERNYIIENLYKTLDMLD